MEEKDDSKFLVKTFLDDVRVAKSKLPIAIDKLSGQNSFERLINISLKVFNEIEKKCGPHIFDPFYCEIRDNFIPENTNLTSLEHQKKMIQKRKTMQQKYKDTGKLKHIKDYSLIEHLNNLKNASEYLIQHPEILLTINFYHPHQIYSKNTFLFASQMTAHVDQSFDVLSHTSLAALKDKVFCNNDFGICEDISENPKKPVSYFTKDIFKSGCFLIENTFYNDMRQSSNSDYSDVMQKWSQDPSRGLGPYKSTKMEDALFMNLEIKLGKPYLYLHQGDCQHLFIFSDLRLVNGDDPQSSGLYPLRTYISRERQRFCYVCGLNPVSFITFNDSHVPDDPSLFCNECFMLLHYDEEGKKKGTFKAYPFYDRNRVCGKKVPTLCTI